MSKLLCLNVRTEKCEVQNSKKNINIPAVRNFCKGIIENQQRKMLKYKLLYESNIVTYLNYYYIWCYNSYAFTSSVLLSLSQVAPG